LQTLTGSIGLNHALQSAYGLTMEAAQ
jgi:hypothetical protein